MAMGEGKNKGNVKEDIFSLRCSSDLRVDGRMAAAPAAAFVVGVFFVLLFLVIYFCYGACRRSRRPCGNSSCVFLATLLMMVWAL